MTAKTDLNSFADELKNTIDIVEHIRKHESLKLVGNNWQGPHSAHSGETSESTCFSINQEEGYFNCFSCGQGGDVIAYEAERLGETQVEAMKSLAREYSLEIPDLSSYDSLTKEEKDEIEKKGQQIKTIDSILRDYENEISTHLNDKHINYLISRGLTEESIDKFKIGYTPSLMDNFIRKYKREDLIASGLFTEGLSPILSERITIPFRKSNKPVHFLGRSLNKNADAKYLSQRSAREKVNEFAVSRSFWSHGAINSKKKDDETYQAIVVVEGTLDALLAAQQFENDYIIISCNTTTISNEQAIDLARMLTNCSNREIVVCNDAEESGAGHRGALKTIEKLSAKVREALIRSKARKDKITPEQIDDLLKDENYMPRFMPRFKMTMLRKSPDAEKVDVADYISENRTSELRKWIESGITVQQYKQYLIGDPQRFFGRDDGSRENSFIDKRLVDELQWEGRFYLYQGEMLYRYSEGVYIPDENMISVEIDRKLGNRSTNALIERTVKLLCATTGYIPDGFIAEENKTMVNTKSGWLNFSKTALSEDPELHTPYRISYAQIGVEYDPKQKGDKILKFLDEVLSTSDVGEFLKLVGYIATRETKHEKAFLFSGIGGNGKSTAIKVLQNFLGSSNYSVRSLHSIEDDKFAVADLFGKLANFNSDLPARYIPDGENFKRITTGEEVTAERKHKDSFQFIPECTLVFSANEIPKSSDVSYGYYRRWKFFAFDRTFTDSDDQDRNLLEKLIIPEELSGLLNRAWEFHNFLEVGNGFTESERSKEIMAEYQADNDIVMAFTSEFLVRSGEGVILKQELYDIFKSYVEVRASSRDRVSQIRFNRRMRTIYSNYIVEATDHTQGNRTCWRGIDLNEDSINELDLQKTNLGTTDSISFA